MAESCLTIHVREHEDFGLPKLSNPTPEAEQKCCRCGKTHVKLCPRCWSYFCVGGVR